MFEYKNLKENNNPKLEKEPPVWEKFPSYRRICDGKIVRDGPFEKPYLIKRIEVHNHEIWGPYAKSKKNNIQMLLHNYEFMKDFCDYVLKYNINELGPRKNFHFIHLLDQSVYNSVLYGEKNIDDKVSKLTELTVKNNDNSCVFEKDRLIFFFHSFVFFMQPARFIYYVINIYPDLVEEIVELYKSGLNTNQVDYHLLTVDPATVRFINGMNQNSRLLPIRYVSWLNFTERLEECLELIYKIRESGHNIWGRRYLGLKEKRSQVSNIKNIDKLNGLEFENKICEILEFQGYQTQLTQTSNDFGVDIIAERSGLKYAIQAKRYKFLVGVRAIQEVYAGKRHYHCDEAIVITNSHFTRQAIQLAKSNNCILIDREKLEDWIQSM